MTDHRTLMRGLSVLHLRFTVEAESAVVFDAQPGSALRGALYTYMRRHYCSEASGFAGANHQQECPVCWLLALEDEERTRGRNLPRPLTLQPPSPGEYARGARFTFGVTLIGRAQRLMVYLLRAGGQIGWVGVGKGRGTFRLIDIAEYSPLLDTARSLQQDQAVRRTTLHVDAPRIEECAGMGTPDRVTLHLLTPMRLIADKTRQRSVNPMTLSQRLIERCQDLVTYYGEGEPPAREAWIAAAAALRTHAETVRIAYDETEWVEAWSGSRRQDHLTPIGGLTGVVRFEGEGVAALRPWLLWGQSLHVGKDAVKGNGWYRVLA